MKKFPALGDNATFLEGWVSVYCKAGTKAEMPANLKTAVDKLTDEKQAKIQVLENPTQLILIVSTFHQHVFFPSVGG